MSKKKYLSRGKYRVGRMNRIYLIGFMGCGKSAVGRRLSFLLKLPFYDMDKEIVRQTGKTIPEIFEQHGEEYFRELETQFLQNFKNDKHPCR